MSELPSSVETPAPSEPATPSQPRHLVRRLVLATLLGGLVFVGLSLYTDIGKLRANLSTFHVGALGLAITLASANYGLRFLRWQYYLRRLEIRVPAGESALVFLAGFVMSVTPGKVGEMFKSLLLFESRGTPVARTAPIVIAERLTDLIALVVLCALGSLSLAQGPKIAAVFALSVAAVLAACAYRPLGELGLRIAARLPLVKKLAPKLRDAYESLYVMTRPLPLAVGTSLAIGAWTLEVLGLWVIVRGFPGCGITLEASAFTYASSTIAGALAMMPGGLGVTEAGMTGMLQALGGTEITPSIATAATILARIATLWWAVAVGAAALTVFRRRMRRR
jgi:uncharacterized protein (TIRG00374 family)